MALNQGNQGQTGKLVGQNVVASFGEVGDTLVSELAPKYYELAYRGQGFFAAATNQTATAYTGGAGGTPILAIWNPAQTGKNLVLAQAMMNVYTQASAAGLTSFQLFVGPTAAITQATVTSGISTLSGIGAGGGSVGRVFTNVALTSSSALTYFTTIGSYYWATAAASNVISPCVFDCGGSIIVPPGSALALAATVASATMTGLKVDASLVWYEIPV